MLTSVATARESQLPGLLRLLADRTRLRVLALVAREELSVGELARILGLSASRLGNHLRLLREAELITDRKEGAWSFVRLAAEGPMPPALWETVTGLLESDPEFLGDASRLRTALEARRARSRRYFDRVATEWDVIGSDFQTGAGRQRVAASLVSPHLTVADVGCGTGHLSSAFSPLVREIILVDHSPAMLDRARKNLEGSRARLDFRQGELDRLPMRDGEVDAVVAGMVLHHAPDLTAFVREAWRSLRPGGVLVALDLLPHGEGWLRESMADLRLGIVPDDLARLLREIGFEDIVIETLEDRYTPGRSDGVRAELPLFLLRGRKPGDGSAPGAQPENRPCRSPAPPPTSR